jgi:acetyl-CoA C-acetyltransferase
MNAAVYGVGTTEFGKQPLIGAPMLVQIAVQEAIEDAGVDPSTIEAIYLGTVFGEAGVAVRSLQQLGLTSIPVITLENACASGTTAYHEAVMAVEYGRYETVLAVGVETMTSQFSGAIIPEQADAEGRQGMALPSVYAMSATRYQHNFGLTNEQLAMVSVKNHRHGMFNPRAQHRSEVSIEQVLESRMIADPLTIMQCCSISDAAAAAIIGKPRDKTRDTKVLSTVLRSGGLWDSQSQRVWGFDLIADTARQSFEQAGISITDADLIEVHDAFTIGEIVTLEAMGLAPEGEGGRLAEEGVTMLGGSHPVNASGGLLSRGHPLGATGLAQIAEIVWQLRGDAGGRQVEDARIGVVETMGGGTAGVDGNACVITVLSK